MISGLNDKLVGIIHSHPSITIGTCDRALVPSMSRGFGGRVRDDGAVIELVVSRWPGPSALDNMRETGRLAATFTAPETFEAFQVKGRFLGSAECSAEDLALVQAYTATIRRRIEAMDETLVIVETTFSSVQPFLVRMAPEVVFEQTPGQNAGRKL